MIQFGFCELAVIPVRSEPSDKAEMSTQMLFGDIFKVKEIAGPWLFITSFYDGYEGWIDQKQARMISGEEYKRLSSAPLFVNRRIQGDSVKLEGQLVLLPAGCSFYDVKGRVMAVEDQNYVVEGNIFPFRFDNTGSLMETAFSYLSAPYLWGGRTCFGLDCSGFTQIVFKQHGIRLFRDASQQASQGELIPFLSDGMPGDLAFFDNEEGTITHTGILLDNQKIIHCSARVRIDDIDHQGIFNREKMTYTHKLRLIRRVTG
ncbi:MAG TPA: C40 family peptidase [Bacteroidales bacterium]|nr:C40 family peptidase [Bacteroidales bacterium]